MKSPFVWTALPVLIITISILINQFSGDHSEETVHIRYEQSDEVIPNPERGFYSRQNWTPGSPPLDPIVIRQLRNEENITIIGRSYFIEDFIDADFTPEFLELIEQDFQAVREAGAKSYFRFRYSIRIGNPDAPLERVLAHIDQLKPIMQRNY